MITARLIIILAFGIAAAASLATTLTLSGPVTITGNLVLGSTASNSSVDCTHTSTGCVQMASVASADPANTTSSTSGWADPSIRRDPQTGIYWIGYTYLEPITGTFTAAPCPAVTGTWNVFVTHLLWWNASLSQWVNTGLTNGGVVYPAIPYCNVTTNKTDLQSSEVVNWFPLVSGGITNWFSVRLTYTTPPGPGGVGIQPATGRFAINEAPDSTGALGPSVLYGTTPQYVGGSSQNDPNFPVTYDFTSFSSQLAACTSFREPFLWSDGSTGYLGLNCGSTAFTAWFSAPNFLSSAPSWTWSYINNSNSFATAGQAQTTALCPSGQSCSFTELDVMPNAAGTALEVIATVATFPGGNRKSWGVVAMHMAGLPPTLSPPALVMSAGNVVVDATVTSSDSTSEGPGSGTYESSGPFGIIIPHREVSCPPPSPPWCSTQGGFFSGPLMGTMSAIPLP